MSNNMTVNGFIVKKKVKQRGTLDCIVPKKPKEKKIRYCEECGKETYKYSRHLCEDCRMERAKW